MCGNLPTVVAVQTVVAPLFDLESVAAEVLLSTIFFAALSFCSRHQFFFLRNGASLEATL